MTAIKTSSLFEKEAHVAKLEEELNVQMQEFDKIAVTTPKKTAIKTMLIAIGVGLTYLHTYLVENYQAILALFFFFSILIGWSYLLIKTGGFKEERRLAEVIQENENLKILYYRNPYRDRIDCYAPKSIDFILVPIKGLQIEFREDMVDTFVATREFPYNPSDSKNEYSAKIIVPVLEDVLKWKTFLEKAKNSITIRRVLPPEEK